MLLDTSREERVFRGGEKGSSLQKRKKEGLRQVNQSERKKREKVLSYMRYLKKIS